MFERIIEILRTQLALYRELLESSRQKKLYLLNNDIESIRRATTQENRLIGSLQRSEREREKAVSDIAARLRIPLTGLTLAKLTSHINDIPVKRQLDSLRLQLRAGMDELKSVNEENKALIDQSLEYIDYNMNLLRNSVSDPIYAGMEEIHGQVFFDARG